MKQVVGIFSLLLFVFVATALMSDAFLKPFNLENLMKRTSLFGIISIGVAFVIITGGIDLSIGSIICLVGCGLPFLLQVEYVALGEVSISSVTASTGRIGPKLSSCMASASFGTPARSVGWKKYPA